MKNRLMVLGLWLFAAGGLLLSSCTKNDEGTIVVIGTENYIDDILTVIPDSLQTQFMARFGEIPRGAVPPKIEGSYVVDPKTRIDTNVDNLPLQIVEPNTYLRFDRQHNGIAVMDLNESTEQITDTVFVMGNGNKFTVYFIENKSYVMPFNGQSFQVWMKRGIIIRGQVTADGLADFRLASIIMKAEDNSNGVLSQYAPGSYFIYKDGDGTASNFDW